MKKEIETPKYLYEKVIKRIERESRIEEVKKQLFIFLMIFIISLLAFIPAFSYFQKEISQSEFREFVSLAISDSRILISYWRELIFSLAETLPVSSSMSALSSLLIMLISLNFIIRDIRLIAKR
ncbi:MAG: hypothetical protein M1355_03110 [Patescibacteria group bacterium]|nr:hypothetical protein [Patescibacteria group bacterium]